MDPVMVACERQVDAWMAMEPDRVEPVCVQMMVNVPVAESGEVFCQVPAHVPLRSNVFVVLDEAGVLEGATALVAVVALVAVDAAVRALETPHAPRRRPNASARVSDRKSERAMMSSQSGLRK
jgi:hypothetical protein